MKRSVYECRLCGDGKKPCRFISLGQKTKEPLEPKVCPYDDGIAFCWVKVSECEIPDDDESKEAKDGK